MAYARAYKKMDYIILLYYYLLLFLYKTPRPDTRGYVGFSGVLGQTRINTGLYVFFGVGFKWGYGVKARVKPHLSAAVHPPGAGPSSAGEGAG